MLMLLAATALTFGLLLLAIRPLELVFPAKPEQRFFRPAWLTDICFFLGHHLWWGAVVLWVFVELRGWADWIVPGNFRAAVAEQAWWLQVVEVTLLSDFFMYWSHRLQHRVAFLWRFHAIHHSAEHLDWLAAHREHPLESITTMALINLPPILLGFPLQTIAAFLVFRGVWAAYLHANVRLPLGPFRVLLGSPELHHWHHAREGDMGNYATMCPLMDLFFGTYHCPDHEPAQFGVEQPVARTYLGHMVKPFLKP